MQALAAVGFSNLSAGQNEVLQLVPKVSARVARTLQRINHDSLPSGILIYSYFDRLPTGRKPVHLRMLFPQNDLLVRLDVVAPREDARPEDVLNRFLFVWQTMEESLDRYLGRRGVPHAVRQSIAQSLKLPSAPLSSATKPQLAW